MNDIDSIATYMSSHNLHLVTAESCTAGLIAARLVDAPGAGEILDCAFVTYSPAAKLACLNVNDSTIRKFGLTSEEVSIEMAQGALDRSQANVAISNTGVTEPMPSGPPAGTQCFAWVFKMADNTTQIFSDTRIFHGERNEIRAACAEFALRQLIRLHANLKPEGQTRYTPTAKAQLASKDAAIVPAEPAVTQDEVHAERDLLPELGLKRPDKQ